MNEILMKCADLSIIRNNKCLLNNANLSINVGDITWLSGASGSGKTSFVDCLNGSLYYSGKINFLWSSDSIYLAKVSYVGQFSQFKDKYGMSDFYYQQRFNSYDAEMTVSVREDLQYLFEDQKVKNNLAKLVELFKFENKLSSSLLHLSSGERKKLQLIKILSNPTQLIILDNPLTGLDKLSMAKLNNYITELSHSGVTFIIIDRINYIFESCSKVVYLNNQQLISYNKNDYLAKMDNFDTNDNLTQITLDLKSAISQYNNIVEFKNVSINYAEKQILSDINWLVKSGEKWLLEGENGAGKSTILSLINGDNPQAYANDIWLFDKKRGSGETIWDIKSKIGYISPELQWNFARNLTCLEVVLSGYFDTPGLYSKATAEQIIYAKELLSNVNMTEYIDVDYIKVANGIQRSILLIRALIKNPPLLIFDEPCQGMSETQSQFFVKLIDKLFRDSQHTIIYVTHRIDEMPECLNKRLTITNGKVFKNEDIIK